jgi:hypothetical protein
MGGGRGRRMNLPWRRADTAPIVVPEHVPVVHEPTDAERLAFMRLGAEDVEEEAGATARPESATKRRPKASVDDMEAEECVDESMPTAAEDEEGRGAKGRRRHVYDDEAAAGEVMEELTVVLVDSPDRCA